MGCEAQKSPRIMAGLIDGRRAALQVEQRRRASPSRVNAAFTLVELLTVISIIAILATLLLTTLSSVKRKAREAVCTSNLHQIGIALNLYLEDAGKRPPDLLTLVTSKYLGDGRILTCPADKSGTSAPTSQGTGSQFAASVTSPTNQSQLHVSYKHPLAWPDDQWNRLLQTPSGPGIAICFYHDIHSVNPGQFDNSGDALVLRGNLDGTVVRRQIFGSNVLATYLVANSLVATDASSKSGNSGPPTAPASNGGSLVATPSQNSQSLDPPWTLFSDDASP